MKYSNYIAAAWLGFSLRHFCNVDYTNYQLWVVLVPTMIFYHLYAYNKSQNKN